MIGIPDYKLNIFLGEHSYDMRAPEGCIISVPELEG